VATKGQSREQKNKNKNKNKSNKYKKKKQKWMGLVVPLMAMMAPNTIILGRLKLINIQFSLNIFSPNKPKNIGIVELRRGFLTTVGGKR